MTTPAGSISLAQEYLRTMLGDVPAFRLWVQAGDQAAALLRIHHEGLPAPREGDEHSKKELEAYRPYAVVYTEEQRGFSKQLDAMGSGIEFRESGRLKLRLYQNCPQFVSNEPTSGANLTWKNTVGQIIDGLCELAGQAGYLAFSAIRIDAGPYWSHPKAAPSQGVWQGVEIGIDWIGN